MARRATRKSRSSRSTRSTRSKAQATTVMAADTASSDTNLPTTAADSTTTTDAAQLAIATPICFFVEKLSSEIRINIYERIFGPSKCAKYSRAARYGLISSHAENESRIHTSICAVNKLVHDEALEAFYNTKVMRLKPYDLYECLSQADFCRFVRDISIVCDGQGRPEMLRHVLEKALELPRLRSISIEVDELALTPAFMNGGLNSSKRHVTVSEFVKDFELGDVTCTDIGVFKLSGKFEKVSLVHNRLRKMWPAVLNTPKDYNALEHLRKTIAGFMTSTFIANLASWASHTSFQMWVALADTAREKILGLDPDEENATETDDQHQDLEYLNEWCRVTVCNHYLFNRTADPNKHIPLRELRPHHDPKLLERATEFLSANIRAYELWEDDKFHGVRLVRASPKWVDLGEKSEGAIRAKEHQETTKRFEAHFMIKDPVKTASAWHIDTVREDLLAQDVLSENEVRTMNKDDLQRALYFLIAADLYTVESEDNAEIQTKRDDWSVALLRQYLKQFTTPADRDAVDGMSLDNLRIVVKKGVILAKVTQAMTSSVDTDSQQMLRERLENLFDETDPAAVGAGQTEELVQLGEHAVSQHEGEEAATTITESVKSIGDLSKAILHRYGGSFLSMWKLKKAATQAPAEVEAEDFHVAAGTA